MEIKATLKKPYNYKERASFVSKWGMYEIKETDTELQAWGMTQEEQEELAVVSAKIAVRSVRNEYLEETDKFVSIPDFPVSEEEKSKCIEYRKYLRDYPESNEDWYKQNPKTFEDWRNECQTSISEQ